MQIVKADGFKKQYALTYLMKIEYSCFTSDFVTRKDFKHNYDRTNFLLDIDNIIVGYYMWYSENDYAYLYSLAIDKYYQGNGYSKLLLDHFLTNSKYNKHCLHVNPSNIIAIQLYRNYNFKNIGYFNNFYEDGAPAVLMQRE